MECLRCGANLKENTLVCPKCGLIMKGAQKKEITEPVMTFEERINAASAEELRAMILAYKKSKEAPAKAKIAPEVLAVKRSKRWAIWTFIFGILSLLLIVIPGVNIIADLILFVLAFVGFGKSAGYHPTLALIGLIMTVVAIAGSWVYNSYAAESIGKALGLIKETAENTAESAS